MKGPLVEHILEEIEEIEKLWHTNLWLAIDRIPKLLTLIKQVLKK